MEISRRECLRAFPVLMSPALFDGMTDRVHIGCQTNAWPIQPNQPETLYASLEAIKGLKFDGFETGFRNLLPLRGKAAELHQHAGRMTFFGVHIFLNDYDPQTLVANEQLATDVIGLGAELGAQRLILSGAPARNSEAVNRKADALNRIAVVAKQRGLGLGYHNHGPEFSGRAPEIDALVAQTNPALVSFVVDAGHAFRAGADIPAFIRRNSVRIAGLHLRDFTAGKQVPLGAGDFPLEAVAKALADVHYGGWVLAEEEREDGSKPAEAAAGPARTALKKYFGV